MSWQYSFLIELVGKRIPDKPADEFFKCPKSGPEVTKKWSRFGPDLVLKRPNPAQSPGKCPKSWSIDPRTTKLGLEGYPQNGPQNGPNPAQRPLKWSIGLRKGPDDPSLAQRGPKKY